MTVLAPWNDRAGRFSALRLAALLATIGPAVWIGHALWSGRLAAEPYEQATHLTGNWILYFLLATLAVTPLRRLAGLSRLIIIRRLLGIAAFAFAFTHLLLYVAHESGDLAKVASEIVKRFYLTIGFITVLGLGVLAATSFDAAIKRLGPNWRRLHQLGYALTALGLLHFFLQSKVDVSEPVILTGVFYALMLHRAAPKLSNRIGAIGAVLAVALVAAALTAATEIAWYALMSGVPVERVWDANWRFGYRIAPMWKALAITAAPALVILARQASDGLLRRRAARA